MRNAELSKEKILAAALREFSDFGIAGARVDRIAKAAGCNKNLIYIYFESKEALFETILRKHLTRIYEELHFTPEDLPDYAARIVDFAMANPDLMRLLAWFGLERKVGSPAERSTSAGKKVAALAEAQAQGMVDARFPPAFLLTIIMSISTAWTAVNPFGPSFDQEGAEDLSALRRRVSEVVRLLVRPPAR